MVNLLSSGISILNVSLSPIRTVSTSLFRLSNIRILGGGASGAEVMLIISGSLCKKIDSILLKLKIQRGDYLPDRHHSKCYIFRRHIISAFDFIDFVSLCHYYTVVLKNNCVAVDTCLYRKKN